MARREYIALVTTRSFWLGLLLPPLLGLFTVVLAVKEPSLQQAGPKQIVLLDHSGSIAGAFQALANAEGFEMIEAPGARVSQQQRAAWAQQLQQGTLLALIELTDPFGAEPVLIYVENVTGSTARWLASSVREAVQRVRLQQAGLGAHEAQALMQPIRVQTARPGAAPQAGDAPSMGLSVFVPFVTLILIMMGVMSGAVPLLQAVVEEKQQRISEVLLGAVSPPQLMLGKLLGTTAVGTTVLGCNLTTGVFAMFYLGLERHIPIFALLVAVCISVVAMLLYGSLFLARGSASSELKEAQGLLMPVMLLFLAPMAALPALTDTPNSSLSIALSLFPLTAPLAMPVRMGVTQTVPDWQVALCIVLVTLATACTLWAAGRVFRIGMLSQGKLPNLRELIRWVVQG